MLYWRMQKTLVKSLHSTLANPWIRFLLVVSDIYLPASVALKCLLCVWGTLLDFCLPRLRHLSSSVFFSRQEHTRATRSSYPSVYGVRSFSCHQRVRILLFIQAYKLSQTVAECRSGVSYTKNIKILILWTKVIPVYPSVVDPDSVGLASLWHWRERYNNVL